MANAESKPFYKRWEWWVTVATIAIAIWQAVIAQGARADAQQAEIRKQQAEAQAAAEQTRNQELERKLGQERTALCQFAPFYQSLLRNLHDAASRYKEAKTPENEQSLLASAQAFVNFVVKWRQLQPLLAAMLDGEVTKLADGLNKHDLESVELSRKTIEQGAETTVPVLQKALENAAKESGAAIPPPQPTAGNEVADAGVARKATATTGVSSAIDCDCSHVDAGLLTGPYRDQCRGTEKRLKELVAAQKFHVEVGPNKTLVSGDFCDPVTQGPQAWPVAGAPAIPPPKNNAPPCVYVGGLRQYECPSK